MLVQRPGEERTEYLTRVLYHFMKNTIAGECTVDYDDTTCDGHCLAEDFIDELGLGVDFDD
jgi:hypothetical protein